ncbi:hypothetical protein EVAR_94044_1 [Eumeta japonica]|uniref:Uncharacterized protein n=1 Tax=Eumeta variegata TaxID=151549 RepID=A0A4C1V6V4_EUMVA|nr:hypothetical protein EVAR_94044_1 [Eumeta japonica]
MDTLVAMSNIFLGALVDVVVGKYWSAEDKATLLALGYASSSPGTGLNSATLGQRRLFALPAYCVSLQRSYLVFHAKFGFKRRILLFILKNNNVRLSEVLSNCNETYRQFETFLAGSCGRRRQNRLVARALTTCWRRMLRALRRFNLARPSALAVHPSSSDDRLRTPLGLRALQAHALPRDAAPRWRIIIETSMTYRGITGQIVLRIHSFGGG